jgi:hypothetical protein
MKFKWITAGALLAISSAAPAMPVDVFLAKTEALQAKGFAAMFSGDLKLLTNTIEADAAALKSERQAAQAAHRTPSYCAPGPVQMGQQEIIDVMRSVSTADRHRTDTRDALRMHLAQRFPCRG